MIAAGAVVRSFPSSSGIFRAFGTTFANRLATISERLLMKCGSRRRTAALFMMIARSQCEIGNAEFAANDALGKLVLS